MAFLAIRPVPGFGMHPAVRAASPPGRIAPSAVPRDRTLIGILAILGSTIAFPLSDFCAQSLMEALPPVEVAWLRYLVLLAVTLPLLRRGRAALRSARPWVQILRGTMSAVGTLVALVAFKHLAVAETTAIGFIAPVFVTALAVIVLKEQVGVRRWIAALVALAGVLIIVQPGAASFRPIALLPLGGAMAGAVAVICTRLLRWDDPRTTVLYASLMGTLILSVATAFDFVMPTLAQLKMALAVGIFGAVGICLQVFAYRLAPASLLAPLTSVQLIVAGALGYVLYGAMPGPAMGVGAVLIMASALYTAARERRRGVV